MGQLNNTDLAYLKASSIIADILQNLPNNPENDLIRDKILELNYILQEELLPVGFLEKLNKG